MRKPKIRTSLVDRIGKCGCRLVHKVETQFPLAVQCCEHLNRAMIMERFSADAKGIVGSLHGSTLDV